MDNYTSRITFPQQIASAIERKIQKGEYKVGDKLPTEPQLSERFGVSRGTIREALKALTSVGLLESRQGAGTYVKAKERLQIAMYRALSSSNEKNILEVKNMLEKHVVTLAAENRKRDDLKRMRNRLDKRNTIPEEFDRSETDMSFHISVAEATHNDLLLSLYRYILGYFSESFEKPESSIEETAMTELHEKLYTAIENQDSAMAEKVISEIIEA